MAGILPRTGAAEVAAFARGLPREELEGVLDLLPTPVLLIEPVTARVTFANAAADRMAGGEFPRGKAAEEYHEAYHCTDRAGDRIPDERMPGVRVARGERLEGFFMDWHLPGGVRSLLLSADTVRDEDGVPELAFVAFDDVTTLREAERAMEESLALLDTLFTQAPVGLAFFDRDLRYARVNQALAEINGIPAEDHLGKTVGELLPEMDPAVEDGFRRVLETGEPCSTSRCAAGRRRARGRSGCGSAAGTPSGTGSTARCSASGRSSSRSPTGCACSRPSGARASGRPSSPVPASC
jgi:PAS domain S-box-containing protein